MKENRAIDCNYRKGSSMEVNGKMRRGTGSRKDQDTLISQDEHVYYMM